MSRRIRILTALLLVASLLLPPLAMAVMKCPHFDAIAVSHIATIPCHGQQAPDLPSLCDSHLNGAPVSALSMQLPDPAPAAIVAPLRPTWPDAVVNTDSPCSRRVPAGPAPPLVRFTVLRI